MNKSPNDNMEALNLHEYVENSYLDYAKYVILDRALPHMFDGLKPVQRRIIYAMSELGLKSSAKYKKSARTVGDVLGKFHPHGDVACYEAMVLMAQSFSYRYPLVDGQGNWGSADDPKSFAAMRYTEAKLSKYAQVLLSELGQGNTTWTHNFDGTLSEPLLLPARLPNMLLNGASGIAVGMATDVPPHNMTEVVHGMIHMLEDKNANIDSLLEYIKGPDFPTGAEVVSSKDEIKQMYKSGKGSIRQRARFDHSSDELTIFTVPYQASPAKICQQIAKQMQDKKLPMIIDLTDQSDHENPVCILVKLRSNRVDVNALMEHLYATTDLEKSSRVNLNIIGIDGLPKVCNLFDLCQDWLTIRQDSVTKRLNFRLDKINSRLHILEGLLLVHLNIDKVIKIIREADDAKLELMQAFNLSELQAQAILEIRLKQLAKLERITLESEQQDLVAEKQELEAILASKTLLKKLIKQELLTDLQEHGDARRSPMVERAAAKTMPDPALKILNEPISIVFTESAWVKAAKGHDLQPDAVNLRSGDSLDTIIKARTVDIIAILDDTGQIFNLEANGLPGIRTQGIPLTKNFTLDSGARFGHKFVLNEKANIVFLQSAGFGFMAPPEALQTKLRAGKKLITMLDKSAVITPLVVQAQQEYLAVITNAGRLLVMKLSELPVLKKGKGNQVIKLLPSETMQLAGIFNANSNMVIRSGRRKLVLESADWQCFIGKRAQRGRFLPNAFRQATSIGDS